LHAGVGAPIDLGLHQRAAAFLLAHGLVGENCGRLSAQNLVQRWAANLSEGLVSGSSGSGGAQTTLRRLQGGIGGTGAGGFAATILHFTGLHKDPKSIFFGWRGTNFLHNSGATAPSSFTNAIAFGGRAWHTLHLIARQFCVRDFRGGSCTNWNSGIF